jgi:DNA repair exonuclease SbcCD ATPase subunit
MKESRAMSSDSTNAFGVAPPSPEGLQELIDALKAACREVAAARQQMDADAKAHADQLRADAARSIASSQSAAEGHHRDLRIALEAATRRLADLEQRASDLAERLKGELAEVQSARGRVDAGVEAISSTIRQVRADRETWEAQGRAAEARNDAAVQELRRALADERARVTALEASNKRLSDAHATLEERLAVLEKKKVFGLF